MFGQKKKSNSKTEILPVKKVESEEVLEQPEEKVKIYEILIYGIDKKNLQLPKEIRKKTFRLTFESYETKRRFDEFDAVILFQGIFESFAERYGRFGETHVYCECDKDELDKRNNELLLLVRNKGFACFLLCYKFLDGGSNDNTDLCKKLLNIDSLYRTNFSERISPLKSQRSEFAKFIERYGAACTYFKNYNQQLDWRIISGDRNDALGFIIWDRFYFVPTLIPENDIKTIGEYFTVLAEALVSTQNKLTLEVPAWIDSCRFSEEANLINENETLLEKIETNDHKIQLFKKFKQILILSGDPLKDAVGNVLKRGFEFTIDDTDELKEDLKIIDEQNKPIVFVEVKGTNKGVKREHINQCDSHRERAGMPPDFPSILIINTHIRNSRTIEEKDQDVAEEQIKHAVKTNVLILRTLDLLNLLRLKLDKNIPSDEIINLLKDNRGWLKVTDEEWEIVQE